MFTAGAFNVFYVVTQCTHGAAKQAGSQCKTELGEQGLEYLQGDFAYVVIDKQVVRAHDLHVNNAKCIAQQLCR